MINPRVVAVRSKAAAPYELFTLNNKEKDMRALINIRLPKEDNGKFITAREFRQILQEIGLRPTDMPSEESDDAAIKIKEYCLQRAQPIFDRMPENNYDEKIRKEFSKENIVYASDLPTTNTLFMVTAHTESEYRFRLLNPKIEELQDGCKDLVLRILDYNAKHPIRKLEIGGKIRILEHGLEEPTISGQVVRSRWDVSRKLSGRDYLITIVSLILFIIFTAIALLLPNGIFKPVIERLSTALFTAMVVSAISVYYTFRQLVPVIQWSATIEKSQSANI